MGENCCLQTHIMILETLYDELTHDWERWQSHSDFIDAVLASLPPSYSNVVKENVLGGNTLYFLQFLEWLKTKQLAPMQPEIIDLAGICDIKITSVVSLTADLSISY